MSVTSGQSLPISDEEGKVLKKKKANLLTPLLEFKRRELPYPMSIVPPSIPYDKHEDAKLIG